jgi:hypothetical protein
MVSFPAMLIRPAAYDNLCPVAQAGGGAGLSADGVNERLTWVSRGVGKIAATSREVVAASR